MDTDLANLGIAVDSSDAVKAASNLQNLSGAAERTQRATQVLREEAVKNITAFQQLSESSRGAAAALNAVAPVLDGLLQRLGQTRQEIRGATSDLTEFTKLETQVEDIGRAFDTTGASLENYNRLAQQLGLTSAQTVVSLERINAALLNQSAVGRQVRQVLQDYGLELNGLTTKDADKVLQEFTEKLSKFRDSSAKFRSAQVVLGQVPLDTFNQLNDPEYTPLRQRRERAQAAEVTSARVEQTSVLARLQRENQRARDDAADSKREQEEARAREPWSFGGMFRSAAPAEPYKAPALAMREQAGPQSEAAGLLQSWRDAAPAPTRPATSARNAWTTATRC